MELATVHHALPLEILGEIFLQLVKAVCWNILDSLYPPDDIDTVQAYSCSTFLKDKQILGRLCDAETKSP